MEVQWVAEHREYPVWHRAKRPGYPTMECGISISGSPSFLDHRPDGGRMVCSDCDRGKEARGHFIAHSSASSVVLEAGGVSVKLQYDKGIRIEGLAGLAAVNPMMVISEYVTVGNRPDVLAFLEDHAAEEVAVHFDQDHTPMGGEAIRWSLLDAALIGLRFLESDGGSVVEASIFGRSSSGRLW
jgi:hypothetical protein